MSKFIEDLKWKRKNYKLLKEIKEKNIGDNLIGDNLSATDIINILNKKYDNKDDMDNDVEKIVHYMYYKDKLNEFIEINQEFFRKYICLLDKSEYFCYDLHGSDSFAKLILEEKRSDLLKHMRFNCFTIPTLKMLSLKDVPINVLNIFSFSLE